jgi:hypothetical protein
MIFYTKVFWNRVPFCIGFRGLIEAAEAASAVSLRPLKPTISNYFLEFLGDFEAICETALAQYLCTVLSFKIVKESLTPL